MGWWGEAGGGRGGRGRPWKKLAFLQRQWGPLKGCNQERAEVSLYPQKPGSREAGGRGRERVLWEWQQRDLVAAFLCNWCP